MYHGNSGLHLTNIAYSQILRTTQKPVSIVLCYILFCLQPCHQTFKLSTSLNPLPRMFHIVSFNAGSLMQSLHSTLHPFTSLQINPHAQFLQSTH